MNVAHSAGTHAAKAGAGVHPARGKAGVVSGQEAATGDQGFMALFSSLEDADASGLPSADKDGLAALALHCVGGDAGGAGSGLPPSDPLALAAQAAQAVLTGGVAGGGASAAAEDAVTPAADASRALAAGAGAMGSEAAGAAVSAQDLAGKGEVASADSGSAAGSGAGPGARAGGQPAHAKTQAESDLMKALKAQLQAADANGAAAAQPGTAQGAADGKATAAASASASAGQPSEVQVADSKLAAQLRMADPGRQADAVAQSAPAPETLVLAASAEGALREAQRALEKSASRPGSAATDAGSPGQGFAVTQGAIIDKPSASVDVVSAQAAPDVQVAEQVSYWVSRDVQNAELKLDGLGAKPVEVSISVVGQEAHVEFRTDQPEIRQVLENAMPHLKEMLQNEGMTLAGTTVGTSAQGGQASQGQRDRAEARQAKIALASLAPAQSARAVASGLGGAVDYFV